MLALKLALESKLDKFGNSPISWELFWRLKGSIRFFNNLFGFIELTMVVVRKRECYELMLKYKSERITLYMDYTRKFDGVPSIKCLSYIHLADSLCYTKFSLP